MNERRFVVEIARPVPDENLETAATYVAQRLGIDVARIRTLLAGRTGAVSRELVVEKAEAIAKVFGEAGVMVTVVERAADVTEQQSQRETEDHQPEVDFEYDGPPARDAERESPPWVEDDGVRGSNRRIGPSSSVLPNDQRGDPLDDEEPATIDLRPSSTRWVPSPHAASDDNTYRETYDDNREDPDELGDSDRDEQPLTGRGEQMLADSGEQRATNDRGEHVRGEHVHGEHARGDYANDESDESGDTPQTMFYDERADADDEHLAAIFSEAPPRPQVPATGRSSARTADHDAHERDADFDADDVAGRRGPWLAPERSPFGDYEAAPHDRPQLRRYLLWGLVLSVVVLIVLQVLFAFVGRAGARAADYDDGLAPYRSGDFVAARGIWEDAAGKGDARAQYMLGYLVQNGLGQPWSNRQAAEWYDQAAAQGLPEAQTALARLYLEGLGVQPDAERGLELLRTAAAAGDPAALYKYGELLFHGRWVSQDYGGALEAFESAAAGGSLEAADFVGLARYLGYGAGQE